MWDLVTALEIHHLSLMLGLEIALFTRDSGKANGTCVQHWGASVSPSVDFTSALLSWESKHVLYCTALPPETRLGEKKTRTASAVGR